MSYSRLHIRFGWWSLAIFLSLGFILESFHGLKLGFYLDVRNETRRLMWTLAHSHGTLLALVNIAFGATIGQLAGWPEARRRLASRCLLVGSVLLPVGFFSGGILVHGGDPGLSILIVPAAAVLLIAAVSLIALGTRHIPRDS